MAELIAKKVKYLLLIIVLSASAALIVRGSQLTKYFLCKRDSKTGGCKGKAKQFQCQASHVDITQKALFDHCYQPLQVIEQDCKFIMQRGLCRPRWTKWSEWSECPRTCGHHQRSRRRHCEGVGQAGTEALAESCRDKRHVQVMIAREEKLGVDAKACPTSNQLCPKVNGGWGQWGVFEACDAKCGVGTKVARRNCTQPSPKGGGLPCLGYDTKQEHCSVQNKPCPQDGKWCKWMAICPSSCGYTITQRTRECKCPAPKHGGKPCPGPSDSMGECETEFCPYNPSLSPNEREQMRDYLRMNSPEQVFAYMGNGPPMLGGDMVISCPRERPIRKRLFDKLNRFPRRKYQWVRNNELVTRSERIKFDDEHLVVHNMSEPDEGLYQLMVIRDPGKRPRTVCFFPMPIGNKNLIVRSGSSVNLTCPLSQLDNVTGSLVGAWRVHWGYVPSPRSQLVGSKEERNMWMSNSLQVSLNQSGTGQISRISVAIEGTYSCYAQLMSIKVNGTEKNEIPAPDDKGVDTMRLVSQRYDRLSLGGRELTDIFLIGRMTIVVAEAKSLRLQAWEFLVKNSTKITILFIIAILLPGLPFAVQFKARIKHYLWEKRQRKLDAEEAQLVKARLVQMQLGGVDEELLKKELNSRKKKAHDDSDQKADDSDQKADDSDQKADDSDQKADDGQQSHNAGSNDATHVVT